MLIVAGVCVALLLAVSFRLRGRARPLDRAEIRNLKRFSEQVQREECFPFL